MKKILLISISIISCLFLIDKVSAETINLELVDAGNERANLNYAYTLYGINLHNGTDYFNEVLKLLYNEYLDKYSVNFPFYYIRVNQVALENNDSYSEDLNVKSVYIDLIAFKNKEDLSLVKSSDGYYIQNYGSSSSSSSVQSSDTRIELRAYWQNNTYTTPSKGLLSSVPLFNSKYYASLVYFISNLDLYNSTTDTFSITGNESLLINPGDKIESLYVSYDDYISGDNYVEVDLNNYPYIILSLKDYSKTEEFSTINYVKGQYCLTSVYNYGSTEKKDIIEGSKTKRCSLYYDYFTPVRTYMLESDLKNNAIYYLKAYDTSKENKVKIDTSVFNIHYITEEDKDNPLITINDKKYTPKSYDELTDTATKSEDENYSDGASEKFSITDIFTSPLEFFKKIINAISEFNGLIKELFSFLPDEFLAFILAAFALLVVVAIIKIIL